MGPASHSFIPFTFLFGLLFVPTRSTTESPALHLNATNNGHCLALAAKQLLQSCTDYNSTALREEALRKIMSRSFHLCVDINDSWNETLQDVQVMVPNGMFSVYTQLAESYKQQTGHKVEVVPVDIDQLLQEALFEFSNNLTRMHDGWVLYLDSYYQLEKLSALLDLSNFTAASDAPGWSGVPARWDDVLGGVKRFAYSYDVSAAGAPNAGGGGGAKAAAAPRQVAFPLDGSAPLMYYRADLLAAANLSVPRTWSEVQYVASVLGGRDTDDDEDSDKPLCFKPDPDCSYASALGMVLVPYLQYAGMAQGALLAPEDLQPLLDSPGAAEGLATFARLLGHHVALAVQGEECLAGAQALAFLEGNCALAFGWGELFKFSEQLGSYAKGKYGVAMLPGSESVYDRDLRALVNCTAERCALGKGGEPEKIVRQQDGAEAYVNRAPYMPYAGVVGVVASYVSPDRQRAVFDFMSYVSGSNLQLSLSNASSVVPFRNSSLDPALLPEFVAAGFDAAPTLQYMESLRATLGHPNLVPGPLIPRVEALRQLLGVAAANLSARMDPTTVAALLQQQVEEQVLGYESAYSWRQALKSAYWSFTGYKPPAVNGTGGGRVGGVSLPAVSLAVPVASAVVVVVLSTLYEFKKHRQHRSLFGKVVAPGPFEDTTLLVTDIQDSTALWENLSSSVMDRAIKEHHNCLRKLLLKHSGYESATEGDSFLLAFHCPEDALLFSMEAQVALLECAWPMELLDCEVCRPAYVVHNDTDKRATLLAESGDAAAGLMALPRANSGLSNKSTSEDTSSPQASNVLGAAGAEGNTFLTACQASWKDATAATPNNVLIFRGLRVRMGMHTGISNEADVAYNKAAARMQYSGEILQYGKSVSDAAAGGMILLSEATYRRLPMERLWDKAMVMHVGEYKLKDDLPVMPLYQVTGRRLMGRLGYLSGMRYKEQLSKGVFTAPLGPVAMAYVGIVGVSTLLAWDEGITRESLGLLHACVAELAHKWNGYLVEASDHQVHVTFSAAADAVLWALAVHGGAMELAWPEALLEHELAEELVVGDVVVFRGMRVKSGVDVGHAVGEVNALTGRICYRGKVVSRAARVMQSASSNQVLASGEAWAAVQASSAALLQLRGIVGDRLGPFKLRGVADRVEMVQVRLQRQDVAGADGWAQDLQQGGGGGADGAAAAGEGPGSSTQSRPLTMSELHPFAMTGADAAGGGGAGGAASVGVNSGEGGGGGGGGGGERFASRPLGFLSRASRGRSLPALGSSEPNSAAFARVPPAAAAAGSASGAGSGGGAAQPSSPRMFGGLLRSVRAQSFTAASSLLHKVAGGGGRARQLVRNGTGLSVDPSGISATAPGAAAASAAAGADKSAGVSRTASSTAVPIAAGGAGGSALGGGGGEASAGGGGLLRSLLNPTPRASSGLVSNPFSFPSARKLLPSSWSLAGGGGAGGGGLASGGGGVSHAGARAGSVGGGDQLSALVGMVATSLPAGRTTHSQLSGTTSTLPTEQDGMMTPVGSLGGGAASGAAGRISGVAPAMVAAPVAVAAAVAAPAAGGSGWFPGEMLADVLQGVQEEEETRQSVPSASVLGAGGAVRA